MMFPSQILRPLCVAHTRSRTSPRARMHLSGIVFLGLIACSQGLFYTNSDKGGVPKIGRRAGPLSLLGRDYHHQEHHHQQHRRKLPREGDVLSLADLLEMAAQQRSTHRESLEEYQKRRESSREIGEALPAGAIVPSEDIWQWLKEGIPEHERRPFWTEHELYDVDLEPESSMPDRRDPSWKR